MLTQRLAMGTSLKFRMLGCAAACSAMLLVGTPSLAAGAAGGAGVGLWARNSAAAGAGLGAGAAGPGTSTGLGATSAMGPGTGTNRAGIGMPGSPLGTPGIGATGLNRTTTGTITGTTN